MMEGLPPIEVFCSYAHEDEVWLRKLILHLRLIERERLLLIWHDRLIKGGMDWAQEIDDRLNSSRLILLLISPDFVASDYCYGIEMQRALERHKANEARVIPILVRPVGNWQIAPFARLQALPSDKFLVEWNEREEDIPLAQIANGIYDALEDLPIQPIGEQRINWPTIWNIPFPRKDFFTGREELLKRLHSQRHLTQMALRQPQAISGLGGIGKTQLAVEYAYRYSQEYQVVLWAYAETAETLTTSFTEIARLLRISQKDTQKQEEIVQGVKDWLSNQRNWLLILDNADEPEVLIPFFPLRVGGHLIVTTRAAELSNLGLGFGNALIVKPFTNKQDVPFLLRRAGLKDVSLEDRKYARQITDKLGGLPLALNQAGVYLKTTGSSLASYWQLYQQQRAALLNIHDDHAYPRSVAATLMLSFARVEERNPAAADLLRLSAFLAPDAIPEELLTKGAKELGSRLAPVAADPIQLDQAFKAVRAYSLLTRDPRTRTLIVHHLVQAVLRDSMSAEARQQWMQRVVLAIDVAFPIIDFEDWPICERLLPHALTCATWIEQMPFTISTAANLLNRVGYYLILRGRYKEAEPLLKQALELPGAEYSDRAKSLNNLAEFNRLQGNFALAEPLYLQALSIREQHLGMDHPDTGRNLNNLAILYWQQKKEDQAEQLFRRALSIYAQNLRSEHPDTARSLLGLANLYHSQEKYKEAEPLYLQALSIYERHSRADHPYIAACLNNLAENYRQLGMYEPVEQLYLRSLSIFEQHMGMNHPDTARNLTNLAQLYLQQSKYEVSEALFLRALSIYEQHLVADHLDTAEALYKLGTLYQRQGEYKKAEPLLRRALSIYDQQLGIEHQTSQIVQEDYDMLMHELKHRVEIEKIEDGDF